MKKLFPATAVSFLSITCLCPVYASDVEDAQRAAKAAEASTQESVQASAEAATAKATESMQHMSRASKIIGTAVTSTNGDSLGSINDLIINPENNQIAYVVVSYGGLMGVGDKLFGMPWKSMQWNQEKQNFVINVDQATLAKSPGFDANKWPNSLSEFDQMDQQIIKP